MKLDLAKAAAQMTNTQMRTFAAKWIGSTVEIQEDEFVSRIADAFATAMGQNLYRGLKPDGSGPMPGRKSDGKPRGMGSAIARAIASRARGDRTWFIAAHRETEGHLSRIMQDVEFKAPPIETIGPAIKAAFRKALKVSTPDILGLRQGSRQNYTDGGKRVKLGKLFAGVGDTSMFNDMTKLRLGRQIRGVRKRSIFADALRGPRKRSG